MDVYQERIRPLFDKSGLQDKQLEEMFGFPRGVIYKWGTGKYKSYRNYIPQIASYFHVSADYLLGNTDDPRPTGQKEKPPAQGGELSEKERIVLDKLSRLTPENVEKAREYLDLLLIGQEKKETN